MTLLSPRLSKKKPEYTVLPVEPRDRRDDRPQFHLYKLVNGEYQRVAFKEHVEQVYEAKMGKPLNLADPKTFNEKIQWLKVYDQHPEYVTYVDKIAAREHVRRTIDDPDITIPICQSSENFKNLRFHSPCIVKTNHDSGSARIVYNRLNWLRAWRKISKRINRQYGIDRGEWAYYFVLPKVFTERLLVDNTDYKFHCTDGDVFLVQIVKRERGSSPKELVTDPTGTTQGIRLNPNNEVMCRKSISTIDRWDDMIRIAETLSRGFQYVRVDLYNSRGKIYFGELSFWPLSGFAKNNHDELIGSFFELKKYKKYQLII